MPLFIPSTTNVPKVASGAMDSGLNKPQVAESPGEGQTPDFIKMLAALANKRKTGVVGPDALQPVSYSNGR